MGLCTTFQKLGKVRFRQTRKIVGTFQNATVSKSGGHWYIAFSMKDVPVSPQVEASESVGIDRGVEAFVAMSNGQIVRGPRPGKHLGKKVAKIQRRLSKKRKFSKNWRKQKQKLSQVHSHIGNVRRDFLHKLSTTIVKNHAVVVIENLKTRNMTKTAKGTLDKPGTKRQSQSWSQSLHLGPRVEYV